MKQKLIAAKNMRYNTRQLKAGDEFEASSRDARILIGIKKARASTAQLVSTEPPKPSVQTVHTVQPTVHASTSIEHLRRQASEMGIEVDNRWGARRLQVEIGRKRSER